MSEDEIDPRFRQHKQSATRRRRKAGARRLLLPVGVPVLVLALIGAGLSLTWDQWSFGPTEVEVTEEDLARDVAMIEQETVAAAAAFAAAFIDLPGDPMLIRLAGTDTQETVKGLSATSGIDANRVGPALTLVSDVMVSEEERFITTLPSSPQDFAFFQAQKAGTAATETPRVSAESGAVDDTLGDGGWGEAVGGDEGSSGDFTRTRIENTTSLAFVRSEADRPSAPVDTFVRISASRTVSDLLLDNGFSEEDAKGAEEAALEYLTLDGLVPGQVVAMRGAPGPQGKVQLVQLSVYDNDAFFGTIARGPNGGLGLGSDPWVADDLFNYAEDEPEEVLQEQRFRLIDAFYSTAIRNKVPSVLVGEAIALLSKAHDLDAFANPGDRMELLYAKQRLEQDTGAGQILFIALKGDEIDLECFVYRSRPGGEYGCYGAKPGASSGGGFGLVDGMTTPVQGVLTSRFGPREHPILKEVRLHAGVDWAAPTGTPVNAAFDGQVTFVGEGGGYGNVVRISHSGGRETRYAHLDAFAIENGARVKAGDLIGYVGTTGRSTGPHLHFELRQGGSPIDPMGGGGSLAVETLVNQIIKVESAGIATAKNARSTATGLGQFIESTWIRMMNQYRPDLASTLSREELLDLRTDPTLSREMVTNLAREGESYLRARNHQVTAGRLYLCHFLGAQGAHVVLSSDDEAMLVEVLGEGVIRANPFLTGKTVAYVKEWADRKMAGSSSAVAVVREPSGVAAYREEIRSLLGAG